MEQKIKNPGTKVTKYWETNLQKSRNKSYKNLETKITKS
jgi:hypothetical protein